MSTAYVRPGRSTVQPWHEFGAEITPIALARPPAAYDCPATRSPCPSAYRFTNHLALTCLAPNVRVQRWRFGFPGAAVAFPLWVIASGGLRLYLKFFDTYSSSYGSLGALMILMVWFYLFGTAILVGGEVNSVLENVAARGGDPTAKRSGE